MIIIELCGVPGCGKSTLISHYQQNMIEKRLLKREDLFHSSKILRNILIRYEILLYKSFRQKQEVGVFKALFDVFPDASTHSKVRIEDLYKRIYKLKRQEGVLLLEEGPIQYLSSLSLNDHISIGKEVRDYWSLYNDFEYHVVYCACDNETSIARLQNRNKAAGYYDAKKDSIDALLNVKRDNIRTIIDALPQKYLELDMKNPVEDNLNLLDNYIKAWIEHSKNDIEWSKRQ